MFSVIPSTGGNRFKRFLLFLILMFLAILPDRTVHALLPLMDGGVFINLKGSAIHDTNVFANANESTDLYLTVIPEVQYLREAGVLHLDFVAGVRFIRFLDLSNQDTEDFYTGLSLSYPNRPGYNPRRIGFDIGWSQDSSSNEVLGTRLRSTLFDVMLVGRNQLSDRLLLQGQGGYSHQQFSEGRFSQIDLATLSADAVHIYSDKLQTSVGYRYRHTQTAGVDRPSLNIHDHLFRGGAEGRLSAKIMGALSLGVQLRQFGLQGLDDAVRPFGAISLMWTPRTRTELTLLGLQDFSVTPDDRSVDKASVRLILDQGVYRGFSLESSIGYEDIRIERPDGPVRQDNQFEIGVGFIYDLASGASTALRYSYQNRSSDDSFFSYQRHIVEVSGEISF